MFKYILLGSVAAIVAIGVSSAYSAASTGNRLEKRIIAQYEQNQNSLSKMSNQVAEAAQVPGIARDDLVVVIKAGIEGRYGPNGSSAMFQAMKEAYPGNLDSKLYTRIQDLIESGRNDFAAEQQKLISIKQVYDTALGSPWQGMWLSIVGYPKINLDDYKIIKSDYSNNSFGTGIDKGLKIR